jgi:hypothetical protein
MLEKRPRRRAVAEEVQAGRVFVRTREALDDIVSNWRPRGGVVVLVGAGDTRAVAFLDPVMLPAGQPSTKSGLHPVMRRQHTALV